MLSLVASDSRQISSGSLLHGLLGSLHEGAAGSAAHGGGQRVGRDSARRAVESDIASAVGALRAPDVIVLEVIGDARSVFAPLHPSLQLSSCAHPIVSHYQNL